MVIGGVSVSRLYLALGFSCTLQLAREHPREKYWATLTFQLQLGRWKRVLRIVLFNTEQQSTSLYNV